MKPIINAILNTIARLYLLVWRSLCQRREPWTPQFCRIEEKLPAIYWSVITVIYGYLFYLLFYATFWRGFWAVSGLLFFLWFNHHILQYRVDHPENKPVTFIKVGIAERLERWAVKRLEN